METYLGAFINWEQDNWVKLLPMAKFVYNNAKNASTSYILLKLNCDYQPRVLFEEDINYRLKSRSADKLVRELKELIEVCCQKLLHV